MNTDKKEVCFYPCSFVFIRGRQSSRTLMIPRYTRPAMGRIWSDQNRFQQWLEVELAASEALAELGVVPAEAARLLRQHAGFDVPRIHEIEEQVKHDVI